MVGNNTIKSYVIRRGRMSELLKNNYAQLSPVYCIDYLVLPHGSDTCEGGDKENAACNFLNFNKIFGNDNDVIIEIGFGMGDATAIIAKNNPNINYLGIEVHHPGVAKLLSLIKDNNLSNIRIIEHDALEVLEKMVSPACVKGFHIFFSDPWPKTRHHKRRLMQSVNIELFARCLKPGGYIYFVTDVDDYAKSALDELSKVDSIVNKYNDFAPHEDWRPITKFEKHALEDGRKIKEMYFIKK